MGPGYVGAALFNNSLFIIVLFFDNNFKVFNKKNRQLSIKGYILIPFVVVFKLP